MTSIIPSDIMEKAYQVVGKPNVAMSPSGTRQMVRIVALALLSERERCAAIIEPYTTDKWKRSLRTIMMGCLEKIRIEEGS